MVNIVISAVVLLLVCVAYTQAQGTTTAYYSSNFGYIRGAASGKCFDVSGVSVANSAILTIYDCLVGQQNQQFSQSSFKYVFGGEEYSYYTARHSGKCIDVKGAATGNNSPVIQFDCATSSYPSAGRNQLFAKIRSSKAGYYLLKDLNSGRCLTVLNASTTNASPIVIFDCNDGSNQQFTDVYCNL